MKKLATIVCVVSMSVVAQAGHFSTGGVIVADSLVSGGGTGDLSKAVADLTYAGIGVTNNPMTYGVTNGLERADHAAATYAPISVTIPAASNAAVAGVAASYIPLTNGSSKVFLNQQTIAQAGIIGRGDTPTVSQGALLDLTDDMDIYARPGYQLRLHSASGWQPLILTNGATLIPPGGTLSVSGVVSATSFKGSTGVLSRIQSSFNGDAPLCNVIDFGGFGANLWPYDNNSDQIGYWSFWSRAEAYTADMNPMLWLRPQIGAPPLMDVYAVATLHSNVTCSANLIVDGTITEGGTSLSAKYAMIGVTNNPMTYGVTNGFWNRTEGTNWVATQGYGTVTASSNAAMAGVAAKYLPLVGEGRLDGTNYLSNPTWYGGGGSGKAYGTFYVNDAGSMHLHAPDSGMTAGYLYLGGSYGGFANVLAMDNWDAYFKRQVFVTNDMYVGGDIYEGDTLLSAKYTIYPAATNIAVAVASLAPIKITDARFYLSGLSNSAQSVRARLSIAQNSSGRATDVVYRGTNLLFTSCTSTVVGVAGEFTNCVADASGFVPFDMYTKPDATNATWQTCSNGTGSVVYWLNEGGTYGDKSSNIVGTVAGITISRVNRLRVPDYYDATGGSNIYCTLHFLTPHTNTIGINMQYWSRTNMTTYTGSVAVTNSASFLIPYVR